MENTKFLAQAIHDEEICDAQLNIVKAPVGCGKTTWALRHLAKELESPLGMLYLIDTRNGMEQLISANSDIAGRYTDTWRDKVLHGWEFFSDDRQEDKIVIMTYAKFGVLASQHPEFGYSFEYVICDEMHNLPKFMAFGDEDGEDRNWYQCALERICEIIALSGVRVIGLSATPKKIEEHMICPISYIPVDDDVFSLQTKETISYSNKALLLDAIQAGQKGLAYFRRIT